MSLNPARLVLVAALILARPAMAAAPAVEMAAETQRKLGLATQALPAAHHSGSVSGFARVLDPVPLATLDADVATAAAVAQVSRAEAARTRSLAAADATVSAKVAEAAAAQARADDAKLMLLRRRLGFEWGPAFMTMTEVRRSALVGELALGRAALVRIDAATGLVGARTATLDLGPGGRVAAQILGPARTGDPRLLSVGLIGLVTGPAAARLGSGLSVPVSIPSGGGAGGVLIPRSALIRAHGTTFAYVRKDATHFERREVSGGAVEPGGLFAAGGFRPGEAVVISGAAALYAAETVPKAKED
jgi:multidrug efflux pump subunit AcrA (membrane-fusion protein)